MTENTSRRTFLKGAAALAVAQSAAGWAQITAGRDFAYVGTYTSPGGNGEGIYLYQFDPGTGALSHRELVAQTPNPSWIAIHPSKRFLYAINEVEHYGGNSGSVSAFAIDAATGHLQALNVKSSEGAGPAYICIDASGKFALVANYAGGTIAVLPILADGTLGSAVDVHRDSGSIGPTHVADAPPGSFAISGHDTPHAHIILPDLNNRFVLATDLAQDRIYVYRFDSATGKLTPASQPYASLPAGDGPRHLVFHPNGRWLYSIQEESSTIAFFHYDPSTGSLAAQQTLSALPPGFAGTSFASEILISADGRFIYAGNRLNDTVTVFSVGSTGSLAYIGQASTLGDYPGQLRIAPNGNFLYACNHRSDNITCYRIDRRTGLLHFTGQYTPVGSPGSITFLHG